MNEAPDKIPSRQQRAALKALCVLAGIAVLVLLLSRFVAWGDTSALKHDLSLGSVLMLVVIINLVSFGCFVAMFAAWQWVRGDLKSPRENELDG